MNNNKKPSKLHQLGPKVCLVLAFLMIASIAIVIQLSISMFRSLTMDMLQEQCVSGTNVLAYQLENNTELEDMTQMLDDLKKQLGCEFTIFIGDERAYTTIIQDGQRAVGTKLSSELAAKVLERGESYVGKAQILGTEHLCSYVPTKDKNGQINGLIFAGISMENATTQINDTIKVVSAGGFVLIIISLVLVLIFLRFTVFKPLAKLTTLAQTMEQGDLGIKNKRVPIDIYSKDEIGFLAHIFDNTMNRLNGYIGEISNVVQSIAQGNLTVKTQLDYVGDFVSIKESLDDILTKLNNTMSRIVESSEYVSNGAEQMAIGATALSQGAVEQASSIEDLNQNIQDISEQVHSSAENAMQANDKVEAVSVQLGESNRKMQEMIQAMQEISDSSNEIKKIIKTIEDISFQTNILALNASVEAARAGDVGKGFAVVADEVRELAAKSAEASKTTTDLIERSITAVEKGTKIANETAEQLVTVVSGAADIVDATNRIADASRSQADYVYQIKEQVGQISNVVQTNSATAQESAATSQQLSQQAGVLGDMMSMFRLNKRYQN